MNRPITDLLVADHARLSALLARAREGDQDAYEQFRGGLLRHIGQEEKILLPAIRARAGAAPAVAEQLRADHSALVAMLVPPPSPDILARIASLLDAHDPLEEDEGGLYPRADELLADRPEILDALRAAPMPPLAAHFAGERAYAAIERLAARAYALRSK